MVETFAWQSFKGNMAWSVWTIPKPVKHEHKKQNECRQQPLKKYKKINSAEFMF